MKREWRESDLAPPVRDYLIAQGYTVRSEVKNCDITAIQGDDLIVVELKRGFTIDLLIQAVERQRIADSVYVAIPSGGETRDRYSKRWKGMERLLKRLSLGLILVSFPLDKDAPPTVEVLFHPIDAGKPRQRTKQRRAVLREIAGRSADYNVGGSTGRAILTAYREQAIYIALCLETFGSQTPTALRNRGASPRTQAILHRNVYGWFERLERGVYALRPNVHDYIIATWPGMATLCHDKISRILEE